MAYISQIKLPNGSVYDIKDAKAWQDIADIKAGVIGVMRFVGVTTTPLVDGSEATTIIVEGEEIIAEVGDVAIYGELEFVYNGSKWQEFGSAGALKALAFKDTASATYTPGGTIDAPTFTGTEGNISVSYTPSGDVSIDNFTPSGVCSQPTTTVVMNEATVNSITDVGTLPSCTLPTLGMSVAENTEVLTCTWGAGSFSAGTLPTKGDDTKVATSVKTATTTAPTFTGDSGSITGSFTGKSGTGTGKFTPSGEVSAPSFTGNEATITVS